MSEQKVNAPFDPDFDRPASGGFLEKMTGKQGFIMGVAAGVAVISTLGFFSLFYKGGIPTLTTGSNNVAVRPSPTPTPTPSPTPAPGGNFAAVSPVTKDDHIRGNPNAKVTMIEFSDFQCPFCNKVAPTLKQILDKYPNDVRLVYRHLPLNSIHPYAQKAAEASECAADQGKFWEYHDLLFANQSALQISDLKKYAADLKLNTSTFNSCPDSNKYAERVNKQTAEAQAAGISGTPGTFVGSQLVAGAYPLATFTAIIDGLLKK